MLVERGDVEGGKGHAGYAHKALRESRDADARQGARASTFRSVRAYPQVAKMDTRLSRFKVRGIQNVSRSARNHSEDLVSGCGRLWLRVTTKPPAYKSMTRHIIANGTRLRHFSQDFLQLFDGNYMNQRECVP